MMNRYVIIWKRKIKMIVRTTAMMMIFTRTRCPDIDTPCPCTSPSFHTQMHVPDPDHDLVDGLPQNILGQKDKYYESI